MEKLAIHGGSPLRKNPFPIYNTITDAEIEAGVSVLKSGVLSQFLGSWSEEFYGGPKVIEFEKAWSKVFQAKHTISVNSNTSGLFACVGAAGLGPGDEVIVSPYSMSASAICAVIYGAVPVFADIDPDTFCLDPASIEERITPRTRAIVVVHIFGHPADMDPIMELAKRYNLVVIEDCAQIPLGEYKGRKLGTIGDMGVYSLNYHKHIHTGEGGMIVTDNDHYAEKLQLIRNHGEVIVGPKGVQDITNIWGANYRLTELQAAIGTTQLDRLEDLIEARIKNADYLTRGLSAIPGITGPVVKPDCKHVYYMQAFKYNEEITGVPRNEFMKAVAAELPSAHLNETTGRVTDSGYFISSGYVEPIYLQPIYQRREGTRCSFNCSSYKGSISYARGLCPVTERMHYKELFAHDYMKPSMQKTDLDDVIAAFRKVYDGRSALAPSGARS